MVCVSSDGLAETVLDIHVRMHAFVNVWAAPFPLLLLLIDSLYAKYQNIDDGIYLFIYLFLANCSVFWFVAKTW